MARILVIEDDRTTAAEIAVELVAHGHTAVLSHDGDEALERATQEHFDVITLDRMLPGLDGLTIVARLRERRIAAPVLMISALSDVGERIAGLRAGGDDYLVKPFAPGEMAARVEVLLRRAASSGRETMLAVGALRLDLIHRQASIDGEVVKLLHMEFRLLEFLARHPGQVMSRRMIFEQVWGYYFDPGANLINVHIARLRSKLDRPGRTSPITTVKGEGYRLDAV
ncbi:response regulator transcription factor [Sphingomonas oligophenolica]|uniref:Response regulator transcription factor n=1 Tax=Sphingomonas oligophenolica TaxID=301154 RepID=A0ABU9Y7E4_9SPHN